MTERIDYLASNPFLGGPAELLVATVAAQLKLVPELLNLFGTSIDSYMRMDYSMRELPALRVYNEQYVKTFDSWFVEGDLCLDIILPAALRRNDIQQIQDTITAALLQQFRRPTFFSAVDSAVPGLNELGKTFSVTKNLGFEWSDTVVPLSQMKANFRLDLRVWDAFLESEDRTKDEPFSQPLGDLHQIIATIKALNDDGTVNNTIDSEINYP